MRTLLILPLIAIFPVCFCQPKLAANEVANKKAIVDSAGIYINRINCNSAIVTTTGIEELLLDSNAEKIVSLKGGGINENLFALLDDTLQVLAAHVILTKRLECKKGVFGSEYVYDSSYKNVLSVNFSFNKLNWYLNVNEKSGGCAFHFNPIEITKIKQHWSQRLKFCAAKMYQP